jgi:hypothetical protein
LKTFTDDIITYISQNLANDKDITKEVKVCYAYDEDVTLKPPYIFVQSIDDSDAEQFDTFDGESISYVPIQITAYCQQMRIGGVKYTAREASLVMAEKIKTMFSKLKAIEWNDNIKLIRRVGGTLAMPVEQGATTYFSPIRYDNYINYPYREINLKGE